MSANNVVRLQAPIVAPRNITTPNLGLNQPLVGGDVDIWGGLLNQNAALLDRVLGPLVWAPNLVAAANAGSDTVPANVVWQQYTQTATIATYTTTLPASPLDSQNLIIGSRGSITAWTLAANTGQTVDGAPVTLAAFRSVWYRWIASLATWVRLL